MTTAGLSGFDTAFIRAYPKAGGADGADAIGVRPYRQGGSESASDDLLLLRSIVEGALPASPQVWDAEWGYSSASAPQRVARLKVACRMPAAPPGPQMTPTHAPRPDAGAGSRGMTTTAVSGSSRSAPR